MALQVGVNCGFVINAPTDDPVGTNGTLSATKAYACMFTTPNVEGKVVEMGYYRGDTASGETPNFKVGVYANSGGVPGSLLYSSSTAATAQGWNKISSLNFSLDANTAYWLAVWVDSSTTPTGIDLATSGGSGYDYITSVADFPDPFNGGALADSDGLYSIYAVWEPDNYFGCKNLGGSSTTFGYARGAIAAVDLYTATAGDTLNNIFIRTGTGLHGGVYALSGGLPYNLLVSGSLTNAMGNGWYYTNDLNTAMSGSGLYGTAGGNNASATAYYDAYASNARSNNSNSTLPAIWSDYGASTARYSMFATYTPATPTTKNYTCVNIGDSWKTISGSAVIKVNVGDSWANVNSMKVNVGDAWKACVIS